MTFGDRQSYSLRHCFSFYLMVVSIPDGYLTRPAASKVFNRSKRALERDLDDAHAVGDEDVLGAFQLVTNDDVRREAADVTTELVEKLKKDGMNPMWCVSEAWLESKYGRKGEAKPERTEKVNGPAIEKAPRMESSKNEIPAPDGEPADVRLPANVEFLQERIRTLEREKREEIERNEKREAKLFEQLEVKDRQISAWDEVTQGITRGLATGQITPALSAGSARQGPSQGNTSREQTRTETVVDADESPKVDGTVAKAKEGIEVPRTRRPTKSKARTTPKKKPSARKKAAPKPKATKTTKRSWFDTPITELFSRRDK